MRLIGQCCLLTAFVGSGFSAYACLASARDPHSRFRRIGAIAGWLGSLALTGTLLVLAIALLQKDFRFAYVVDYSSRLLPWHFSLSALWVGQAGSLLLWAWMLAALSLLFRHVPSKIPIELRDGAFGLLMTYVAFLAAVLIFAADPMRGTVQIPREGAGLSPLLQHPSMLIHPPVVFAGYTVWAIPCALAIGALWCGRLDDSWAQAARRWALLGWVILGAGILLGAHWAYQELGWGGYWGWDPVENGSLLPWLTGTALVHGLLAWRHGGMLKRTTLALAVATFTLCNFATFVTRSGIFSSVHAFSQSPIGWMFLGFVSVLLVGSGILGVVRRRDILPGKAPESIWARESLIALSACLFIILTGVVLGGTLVAPLTLIFLGRTIVVGPEFYNHVLMPVGPMLLGLTAVVPLVRWRHGPKWRERRALVVSLAAGLLLGGLAVARGWYHPVAILVAGLSGMAVVALIAGLLLTAQRHFPRLGLAGCLSVVKSRRREYASYVVHLGIVCLAIGITGSSLGTQRRDWVLAEGETVNWAGRQVRFVRMGQQDLPDKLIAEAEFEVASGRGTPAVLRPARHLHLLQAVWTTEVAILSDWGGDFYLILQHGEGAGRVRVTFVDNPLMRWLWGGAWLAGAGALVGAWPGRKRLRTRTRWGAQPTKSATRGGALRHDRARAA